ncbi:MAG: GntR family transcriptional regulator, partial [Actinobacteria bacterium]|nr:GntR family transcriptional regulator [Actinomycetota bacterium]
MYVQYKLENQDITGIYPWANLDTLKSSLMDSNRLPLYLALAQTLRQEIDAKKYKIGALLPPEDQLVVKYGVSRHTVRQALREL